MRTRGTLRRKLSVLFLVFGMILTLVSAPVASSTSATVTVHQVTVMGLNASNPYVIVQPTTQTDVSFQITLRLNGTI